MKKYAKILSEDLKFSRMLTLVLEEHGLEMVSDGFDPADGTLYTVIDLDSNTVEAVSECARCSEVIGYSTSYEQDMEDKTSLCRSFLHRPFLISDLIAALDTDGRPIERRKRGTPSAQPKKHHFLTVDPTGKAAVWGDMRVSLSENEYKLLSLLCEMRGETVTREQIDEILGATEGNMGDVYICHLRRKLDNQLGLKLIYTVRGKGYMLKN